MKCAYCGLEMLDEKTVGCSSNPKVEYLGGVTLNALPYEHEDPNPVFDRCHDCNAQRGQHHHPGCDMERCPKCQGQLISCSCEM